MVYEICKELISTNSRTEKESILNKHKAVEEFRASLNYLLNPFEISGISSKKIRKAIDARPSPYTNIQDVFNYLHTHNSGRDQDIAVVQSFIQAQKQKEFYEQLFSKELRIGVTAKTVNKVFGNNFIPEWSVMTAEKYSEFPEYLNGKSFAITNKIDGNRCIALKQGDSVTMWAGRSGQVLEGFTEIEDAIRAINIDVIVLDGELTLRNVRNLTSIEQYQKATSIIRKDGIKTGIKLTVFDTIPYDEFFVTHRGVLPYATRRKMLEDIIPDTKETDLLYVLPVLYRGNDISQIQVWKDWAVSTDNEGVMVNVLDAPYQYKRTKDILKVKVQGDSDLRIIGFEEGSGKYKGMLGAFILEYKGGTLNCGGGLTDELRQSIWNNKSSWLDRVISVKHNGETIDTATGNPSLRFPRFSELREEGKEVNY